MKLDKKEFLGIGCMSGTSADGLDLAFCSFQKEGNTWSFRIRDTAFFPYSEEQQKQLNEAHLLSGAALTALDFEFGKFIGSSVQQFMNSSKLPEPEFIASHGHTVFHQPEKGITLQVGNGAAVRAASGIRTICDFRTLDVRLGGQGAPLVPIGDQALFSEYDICINIGGFANLSCEKGGKRRAFDICPANFVLNRLTAQIGMPFDKGGKIAAAGEPDSDCINSLNALTFYKETPPKSLGREWAEEHIFPVLEKHSLSIRNQITSFTYHTAYQIAEACRQLPKADNILITGGGAHNHFLIKLIAEELPKSKITVPERQITDFKEALIFAFLGLLRLRGDINTLASVTGASQDSCGGCIYE